MFKKKKSQVKEEVSQSTGFQLNHLFHPTYDLNLFEASEILIEVYRESRIEEDWEVPGTFIGIRLYEDSSLKEDIPLHDFGNFGLFSYTAVHREATFMQLAIDLANSLSKTMLFGAEMYDFKIKKRFLSKKHIFLLDIPSDYEVEMPEGNEALQKRLDLEIREYDLYRKKAKNPDADITEEKRALDQASTDLLNEQLNNKK